jgi:hypothetical protein
MDTAKLSEVLILKDLIAKQDTMIEAQKDLIQALRDLLALNVVKA